MSDERGFPVSSTQPAIHLGKWELVGHVFRPKYEHYISVAHARTIEAEVDPLVTFFIPSHPNSNFPPTRSMIHLSRLLAVGGPLAALVTTPFVEGTTRTVTFSETIQAFNVIRSFLYYLPIDMRQLPPSFALVADRWDLEDLFVACFRWAENSLFEPRSRERSSFVSFVSEHLPVISVLDNVPDRFLVHFALRFSIGFSALEDVELANLLLPSAAKEASLLHHHIASESTAAQFPAYKRRRTSRNEISEHSSTSLSDSENDYMLDRGETILDADHTEPLFSKPGEPMSIHEWEPVQVWRALWRAGVLQRVLRYLALFGTNFRSAYLLDFVLRVAAPHLSDLDVTDLLQSFDWQEPYCREALESSLSYRWPERSCQLLKSVIAGVPSAPGRYKTRPTKRRLIQLFQFEEAGVIMNRDGGMQWSTSEKICNGYKLLAWLEFDSKLSLQVGVRKRSEEVVYLSPQTPGRVRILQDSCVCGLILGGGLFMQDITTRTVRRTQKGIVKYVFTLMTPEVARQWKQAHTPNCGVAIRIAIELIDG